MENHDTIKPPRAFISYSWEDSDHQNWIRDFATRLRADGVDVTLDQWHTVPGDQLPAFMESAVRENDYVLIVCTPRYKEKADSRSGGVGYEGDIMTAEVMTSQNHRKFIPLLRKDNWVVSSPTWLSGKYFVNFSGTPYSEESYQDLLLTVYGQRNQAPPLGKAPKTITANRPQSTLEAKPQESILATSTPIKIVGVVVDGVTSPRNDGTRGSALYAIPFQLSRRPSAAWADAFIRTWNRPPPWTMMHRPGIARVSGDRVILDGTTIEEVEQYHRDTLRLVIESVNQLIEQYEVNKRQREEEEKRQKEAHQAKLKDIANRLKF